MKVGKKMKVGGKNESGGEKTYMKKNFSQTISLNRELRKNTKENTQMRPSKNSLVIKQCQGPLVPPQRLPIIF